MNIGEVVLGYALDAFWISVIGLGVLLLVRTLAGKPAFTDKDWTALCGHTRKEVFSRHLLLRFGALLVAAIPVGLAIGHWIAPLGLWGLIGSLIVAAVGISIVTSWWMR